MLSEMNRGKKTSFLSLIWFFSEVAWPGAYCAPQDLGLGGARGLLGVWLGAWPVRGAGELGSRAPLAGTA